MSIRSFLTIEFVVIRNEWFYSISYWSSFV